jgi:hypothetical protein
LTGIITTGAVVAEAVLTAMGEVQEQEMVATVVVVAVQKAIMVQGQVTATQTELIMVKTETLLTPARVEDVMEKVVMGEQILVEVVAEVLTLAMVEQEALVLLL